MQEDTIIQKNLFAIGNDNNEQKEITKIPEDLSWEDLKKESQKRPRQRNGEKKVTLRLPSNQKNQKAKISIFLIFILKLRSKFN